MNRLRANLVPAFLLLWLIGAVVGVMFMWWEEPMHFSPVAPPSEKVKKGGPRVVSDPPGVVGESKTDRRGRETEVWLKERNLDSVVPKSEEPRSTEQEQEPEEASVPRETWSDPINQEVLGRKAWMGELKPEEAAKIDEVFNTPMPSKPAGIEPRATSVQAFKTHAERCYERFPTIGRVVVIWRLRGDGTRVVMDNLHFGPVVDVDPQAQECLLGFQSGPIATSEVFERWVEYPLIF